LQGLNPVLLIARVDGYIFALKKHHGPEPSGKGDMMRKTNHAIQSQSEQLVRLVIEANSTFSGQIKELVTFCKQGGE
jgi:hypothetical protein